MTVTVNRSKPQDSVYDYLILGKDCGMWQIIDEVRCTNDELQEHMNQEHMKQDFGHCTGFLVICVQNKTVCSGNLQFRWE